MFGAAGNDVLDGGSGDDRLFGGLGNDTLNGGDGTDSLFGGGGDDTLNGDTGNDLMVGGLGNDTFNSGTGSVTVVGGLGNDTINITGSTATIDGGAGTDSLTLSGGIAHTVDVRNVESFTGDTNNDTVNLSSILSGVIDLGAGTDTLNLADGANSVTACAIETINGGTGADAIFDDGGIAASTIDGRAGNDTIGAGAGADELIGGLDTDILTGGTGSDTFTYSSASQSAIGSGDTITDFDATDDSEDINLNGFAAGGFVFLGNEAQAFSGGSNNSEARFNDTTKLLEIDSDGNGTADMEITLSSVVLSDLDAADFTDDGGGA